MSGFATTNSIGVSIMSNGKPRVLLLDIETAPNKVYTWGLFKQNISLSQIVESGYVMCWAAKWLGNKKMYFDSIHNSDTDAMLEGVWDMLDEADVVIHYNGTKFDIPTLNREFLTEGFNPPAPFTEIDLLRTCKSRFRFLSNKLDYVAQEMIGEGKFPHKGMDLWRECMAGDNKAWKVMEKYNKQDVLILEKVYEHLLPWVQPHPNLALYNEDNVLQCTNCGSTKLEKRGSYYTQVMRYQRYRCGDCGKWSRAHFNNLPKEKKQVVVTGIR